MAAVTQSVRVTSRAESSEFMSLKVTRADSVVEARSTKQDAPLEGRLSLCSTRTGRSTYGSTPAER